MSAVSSINRRDLLIAGLGVAAAATISVSAAHSATMDEIKKRGVMNIASEDDYYPFEFIKDGQPEGFHKDVIDELRKYASFKIERDVLPWTGLLAAVTTGKYDAAITGAAITDDRLSSFNFVAPVAADQPYYLIRADDDRIKSVQDLNGLKGGLQAGGAQLARINQLDDKLKETGGKLGEIVQYQAYPEAYADLANGRLDYVVNSVVNLSVLIKERPGVFKLGTAVASRGFVAWPVAKGNDSVLQFLTEFRNHLKETGKLEELQNKWLGMTFPDLPDVPITSLEQFRELTK